MGETVFRYRPFKPLVEHSNRSTLTNTVVNHQQLAAGQ